MSISECSRSLAAANRRPDYVNAFLMSFRAVASCKRMVLIGPVAEDDCEMAKTLVNAGIRSSAVIGASISMPGLGSKDDFAGDVFLLKRAEVIEGGVFRAIRHSEVR